MKWVSAVLAALIGMGLWVTASQAQPAFAGYERASEAILGDPHDLAVGPDGRLYVADKLGGRIVVMDADTLEVLETFGDGQLVQVRDISFAPDGRAYVAITGASAVAIYNLEGEAPEIEGLLSGFPSTEGALAHSNGKIYVTASGTGQLVAVDGEEAVAGASGMYGAHDVAEAPDGTVWVADQSSRRLLQFSEELELLKTLDDPKFGFIGPRYLDFDSLGHMYVADQNAHRVLKINPETEELLGIIGDGSPGEGPNKLDDPEGVAVDGSNFYFSDSDNNRVVKYVIVVN